MNLLHFVLMVAVMTIAWLTMYSPSIASQTAQITTTAVLLCYLVLSVFLYQTYNAYKIGMYRAGETFYSLTLANLIGNALTYLFACINAAKKHQRILRGKTLLLSKDELIL